VIFRRGKEMKVPNIIYLQIEDIECLEDSYSEGVTWCEDRINDDDIKYVRSDIIEKRLEEILNEK